MQLLKNLLIFQMRVADENCLKQLQCGSREQCNNLFIIYNIMIRLLLVLLAAWVGWAYEVLFAINCGSYDRTLVSTKYFNYTVDSFFEGLASIVQAKPAIPQSIHNQADREIVKNHRTTAPGYNDFSYRPILSTQGYHIAIVTLIETQFKSKGQRIFHIKLGDQIVHTVDIVAEAGFGKILHKWIEFDVREDIAFLNGTLPALNAFNFKTYQVRIVLEGVKGKPKLQSFMLLKGLDAHQYLRQFLQSEQQKNIKVKEYISEKYRRQPKLSYRPLNANDIIPNTESQIVKLYNKYFTLRSLGSILCGLIAIHHEKILKYLIDKLQGFNQKLKNSKYSQSIKKKKQ